MPRHCLRGVSFNNNLRFAKLTGKKQEQAYEALVQLCIKTVGTFSSTGCQHGDKFVQKLVDGALKPGKEPRTFSSNKALLCLILLGVNPNLTCLNLESNHITNPGFEALAMAVKNLPNLTTIKLRHQIITPSVHLT